MIIPPEVLLRSIEKLYIDLTEPLDPYIALAMTNLSVKLAETVYAMGYQDGERNNFSDCNLCGDGGCVFGALPNNSLVIEEQNDFKATPSRKGLSLRAKIQLFRNRYKD